MAKDQDCLKIEKALKKQATDAAKAMGISRSSLYRMALIKFLKEENVTK
jgi:antitoxin component of RelBE/YafQ-DinJ toxin-antitoxin module